MASGIEIYDEATGKLVFDATTRSAKFINSQQLSQGIDAVLQVDQTANNAYDFIYFLVPVGPNYGAYPTIRRYENGGIYYAAEWGGDVYDDPEDPNPPFRAQFIIYYGYF